MRYLILILLLGACEFTTAPLPPPPPPAMPCPEINPIDSQRIFGGGAAILDKVLPAPVDRIEIKAFNGWPMNVAIYQDTLLPNAEGVLNQAIRNKLDTFGITYSNCQTFLYFEESGNIVTLGWYTGIVDFDGPYSDNTDHCVVDFIAENGVRKRSVGFANWGYGYANVAATDNVEDLLFFINSADGEIFNFNFLNAELDQADSDSLAAAILQNCNGKGRWADWRHTQISDTLFDLFIEREWQTVLN